MKSLLRHFSCLPAALALTALPVAAQSPAPASPVAPNPAPAAPAAGKTKEKPAPATAQQPAKKDKKEPAAENFDPNALLLKLVFNADNDRDGVLSLSEFRKVPLLKELKKDQVNTLFAEIDANGDAGLDAEEVGKGFGKISALLKDSRSLLDDKDAAKQAKKLKRLTS